MALEGREMTDPCNLFALGCAAILGLIYLLGRKHGVTAERSRYHRPVTTLFNDPSPLPNDKYYE